MLNQRFGPYDITRTLGQGGMGTVYAARDRTTGHSVAVKVLPPNSADDEQLRGRFAAEIETLKRLQHPNIVQIIGYGEQDGALYFSMELVNGKSLFEELKAGRQFHWTEVVRMGIEICDGLRHAHDRGVIHRDLKPGNLLRTQQGQLKLTDFGIAKLFGGQQRTADGGVIGTAEYMSPEQAQGLPVTIRSDLYSLGSVLYALLARRPPFEPASLAEAIKNLTSQQPPPIQEVAPNTPDELAKVVDRLLEKRAEDRIGTAQSLGNRLKSISEEIREQDVDFIAEPPADPNRTEVPDTVKAKRVTTGGRRPPERAGQGKPSFVSTEVPPTVIQGQTNAGPESPPIAPHDQEHANFQVVDQAQRQAAQRIPGDVPTQGPIWPYAVSLVLLLVVAALGVAYSTAPKSANTIYADIQEAELQGADELARLEDEMVEFVERFPEDARADTVRDYLTFVQSSKYPRRLEQQARLRGTDALTPCQRDYLAALRTADTDPEKALQQMEALLVIYGQLESAPPDIQQCVESARLRVTQLRKVVARDIRDQVAVIEQCLARAGQLAKTDPASARQTLKVLIDRFGNKPWAAQLTAEAREMLEAVRLQPATHSADPF